MTHDESLRDRSLRGVAEVALDEGAVVAARAPQGDERLREVVPGGERAKRSALSQFPAIDFHFFTWMGINLA